MGDERAVEQDLVGAGDEGIERLGPLGQTGGVNEGRAGSGVGQAQCRHPVVTGGTGGVPRPASWLIRASALMDRCTDLS